VGSAVFSLRWIAANTDVAIRRALEVGIVLSLVACIVAALAEVLSRYLSFLPIEVAWPDEMARGMMAWLAFLGAALLIQSDEHIRLEVPKGWLGGNRGLVMRSLLADTLLIGGLLVVTWSAFEVTVSNASVTLTTIPVPLAVMSASILVGSGCQLYFSLGRLIADIRSARERWTAA
jgi:TRAP-type C4-dicarboxylate transport system permease small subunit